MGIDLNEICKSNIEAMCTELAATTAGDEDAHIIKIIKEHLHNAFKEAGPENKDLLNRKLSLLMHPDKLQSNKPELFAFLKARGLESEPQMLINRSKSNMNILRDLAENPIDGVKTLYGKISFFLKQMDYYKRYPQSIQEVVWVLSSVITISLIVTAAAFILSYLLVFAAAYVLKKGLNIFADFLTGNQFTKTQNDFVNATEYLEKIEFDYWTMMKSTTINVIALAHVGDCDSNQAAQLINEFEAKTTEEFKEFMIEEQAKQELISDWILQITEDQLNQKKEEIERKHATAVLNSINVSGIDRIRIMKNAFVSSIIAPLPQSGFLNKAGSFGMRPVRALCLPVFLVATAAVEASIYASAILCVAGLTTCFALKAISLGIINMPLYALDLARAAKARFQHQEPCSQVPSSKQKPASNEHFSSSAKVSSGLSGNDESTKHFPDEDGDNSKAYYRNSFFEQASSGEEAGGPSQGVSSRNSYM